MDSGASQLKLEGKVEPKKFEGQLLNKGSFLPIYDEVNLRVEEKATDAQIGSSSESFLVTRGLYFIFS